MELSSPLSSLKGAGPRRTAMMAKLGLRTAGDLLWFFPRRYEDRGEVIKISKLVPGRASVVYARVSACETKPLYGGGRSLTRCRVSDGSGVLDVVWFNRKGLDRVLSEGSAVALYGVPSFSRGALEMSNPDFELSDDGAGCSFTGILPVYPSTEGLPRRWFRETVAGVAAELTPLLKDQIPETVLRKNGLMQLGRAVLQMHRPECMESLREARRRIAYGELFSLHLSLAAARAAAGSRRAPAVRKGALYSAMLQRLPFSLTKSQMHAVDEIYLDAASGRPAARLLQGDVGSGKTSVAVAFAACVCDGGAQCAMLAPTEILAGQLCAKIMEYLPFAADECVLLTASASAAERRKILSGLADGTVKIAVGTQSLLSESISFRRLGAVIIDEQQRFGVRQRARLMGKAESPHLLMLSATPIPRTIALTLYGDLDVSVIEGRPAGRSPVETRVIPPSKAAELMRFIALEIMSGGRVYWICPRIGDESAQEDGAAVKRFEWLRKKLPPVNIALIHGMMDGEKKNEALEGFRSGKYQMLVGTTVLEVGVDVPEASVVVIESPERYGLSQLHQLRGRVGRGGRRGVCVLVSGASADETRLNIFASTSDGFKIAMADLEMRGSGEMAGTAQHGESGLRVADLRRDAVLAEKARADAKEFIEKEGLSALSSELLEKIKKPETGAY